MELFLKRKKGRRNDVSSRGVDCIDVPCIPNDLSTDGGVRERASRYEGHATPSAITLGVTSMQIAVRDNHPQTGLGVKRKAGR